MKIETIVFKLLAFLPCFFTFTNYFTVLKAEQRESVAGVLFLLVSIAYFLLCLYFLITNWN